MPSKLHPLSVPYRVGGSLSRFVWLLVIGTVSSASSGRLWWAVALLGVALIATFIYRVAYVRRFEYELTEDTFDVYSGVLSRRTREIPYHRIQNVDVTRNVIQRALGISELAIETAGGGETEATLRYLDTDTASDLREALSQRKRGESGKMPTDTTTTTEPLFSITSRELLLLGVVGLDLRLLSFVTVLLPVIVPSVSDTMPLFDLFRIAPLVVGGLIAVALAASMVQAVVSYYDFELYRDSDELRYRRGLAKEYSGTIPLDKVQSVILTENVLARRLGYASVAVETAGYSPSGESNGSQSAVPLAERDHAYSLAHEVEQFGDPTFERPPKRARTRYAVRYAIGVLLVTGLTTAVVRFANLSPPLPTVSLLGFLLLVPIAAHLRWSHLGYALGSDHFIARAGFWSQRTQVVPYYRIQTLARQATLFQRRRALATVVVDTAGTHGWGADPQALDIDAETASELRETLESRFQETLRKRRE